MRASAARDEAGVGELGAGRARRRGTTWTRWRRGRARGRGRSRSRTRAPSAGRGGGARAGRRSADRRRARRAADRRTRSPPPCGSSGAWPAYTPSATARARRRSGASAPHSMGKALVGLTAVRAGTGRGFVAWIGGERAMGLSRTDLALLPASSFPGPLPAGRGGARPHSTSKSATFPLASAAQAAACRSGARRASSARPRRRRTARASCRGAAPRGSRPCPRRRWPA